MDKIKDFLSNKGFSKNQIEKIIHSYIFQTYKDYNLRISSSPYINNVGTKNHWFPYRETQFYEFDKYLFANWSRTKAFEDTLNCLE